MGDVVKQAEAIALKHAKACLLELVEQVGIEAIKAEVAKTANPIDDVVVAAVADPLKKALIDLISKIGA